MGLPVPDQPDHEGAAQVIKFLGHETIPLDELETFPGNANIGNVPMISASLAANGQYRSLIVRRTDDGRNIIMAGNHTRAAMVEHGAGRCTYERGRDSDQSPCQLCGNGPWDGKPRCEVFECSDEEATKINVADNRIPEFSKRDDDALADLLMSLEDLTGSGYTLRDVQMYMPQEPPELTHVEFEASSEPAPAAQSWGFTVTCELESQRDALMERLSGEGYIVRAAP
jgi:hypothetical protein